MRATMCRVQTESARKAASKGLLTRTQFPRRHYAQTLTTGTIPTEVGKLTTLGFMYVQPPLRKRSVQMPAARRHVNAHAPLAPTLTPSPQIHQGHVR